MSGGGGPLAVIGTGLDIGGQIAESDAQQKAAKRNSIASEIQAREILKRSKVNQEIVKEEGLALQANQVGAFARAGVDVGSGSPLSVLENTASNVRQEVATLGEEAEFAAREIRAGARAGLAAAKSARGAAGLSVLATGLSGVVSASSSSITTQPSSSGGGSVLGGSIGAGRGLGPTIRSGF